MNAWLHLNESELREYLNGIRLEEVRQLYIPTTCREGELVSLAIPPSAVILTPTSSHKASNEVWASSTSKVTARLSMVF